MAARLSQPHLQMCKLSFTKVGRASEILLVHVENSNVVRSIRHKVSSSAFRHHLTQPIARILGILGCGSQKGTSRVPKQSARRQGARSRTASRHLQLESRV